MAAAEASGPSGRAAMKKAPEEAEKNWVWLAAGIRPIRRAAKAKSSPRFLQPNFSLVLTRPESGWWLAGWRCRIFCRPATGPGGFFDFRGPEVEIIGRPPPPMGCTRSGMCLGHLCGNVDSEFPPKGRKPQKGLIVASSRLERAPNSGCGGIEIYTATLIGCRRW